MEYVYEAIGSLPLTLHNRYFRSVVVSCSFLNSSIEAPTAIVRSMLIVENLSASWSLLPTWHCLLMRSCSSTLWWKLGNGEWLFMSRYIGNQEFLFIFFFPVLLMLVSSWIKDWLIKTFLDMNATRFDVFNARDYLLAMGNAATRLGLTIQVTELSSPKKMWWVLLTCGCLQYCMPLPNHVLQSVAVQSVTQIRASADYRVGEPHHILPHYWYAFL